ncbi:MAG: hypothetical protein FD169_936 [Bacillota bacterium]|nr:MAG: hypothetical protein FD169_936 [Bacillota bacterium]
MCSDIADFILVCYPFIKEHAKGREQPGEHNAPVAVCPAVLYSCDVPGNNQHLYRHYRPYDQEGVDYSLDILIKRWLLLQGKGLKMGILLRSHYSYNKCEVTTLYGTYYWSSEGKAELDFVFQDRQGNIIPLEAKSSENLG